MTRSQGRSITTATDNPEGLGGWLILIAMGLIVFPVQQSASLIIDFLPLFREGPWEELTTPGADAYHPLWRPLITLEIAVNVLLILFDLLLLFVFFKKSSFFPISMIAFLAANALFIVGDFFLVRLIPGVTEKIDVASMQGMARAVLMAAIGAVYFLVSRRVKNTFIRRGPGPEAR